MTATVIHPPRAGVITPDRHLVLQSTLRVTAPLVHADEKLETMQRFRREPVLTPDGEVLEVPILSGNSIRGMLRRAMALRVVSTLRISDGQLPVPAFYLLFSGGFLRGGDDYFRLEEVARMRWLLPPVGLLGASWGSRVLHGRIQVWRGEPVCRELEWLPHHQGHPAYAEGAVPSVFDLLTELSFSRKDDRDDREGSEDAQQMRYSHEALIPGTRLLHGCVVQTRDPLLLGCLADAILCCEEWQSLGGRSGIGHGRFTWDWLDGHDDLVEMAGGYRDHLVQHQDEIRELLGVEAC